MKTCKGTGKAKGFGCGVDLQYTERNGIKSYKAQYGLGKDCGCFTQWLISDNPSAKETFNKLLLKNKKDFEKKQRLKKKKEKEKLIDYKPKLQNEINKIVRLIDVGLPCLAKGIHANQIHAGHVYSRGSNQTIRYNLHNIHRQSAQSNHYQNDDGLLREGVVNEYGQSYMDFISSLRQTPKLKLTNQEYKEYFNHAKVIVKELKNQGRIFPTPEERIFMRNEINNQLGIYHQKYCEFKT